MRLPNKTTLPFFAYGLFKPGQLSYFRIRDFIENMEEGIIVGKLIERDGIPLLVEDNYANVKGNIIYSGRELTRYGNIKCN